MFDYSTHVISGKDEEFPNGSLVLIDGAWALRVEINGIPGLLVLEGENRGSLPRTNGAVLQGLSAEHTFSAFTENPAGDQGGEGTSLLAITAAGPVLRGSAGDKRAYLLNFQGERVRDDALFDVRRWKGHVVRNGENVGEILDVTQ